MYITHFVSARRGAARGVAVGAQRHINGVVSNGVVPKSQICKLVAKPAPDIFRIQGVYHNEGLWRDRAALLMRPGLIRPGLCSPKELLRADVPTAGRLGRLRTVVLLVIMMMIAIMIIVIIIVVIVIINININMMMLIYGNDISMFISDTSNSSNANKNSNTSNDNNMTILMIMIMLITLLIGPWPTCRRPWRRCRAASPSSARPSGMCLS